MSQQKVLLINTDNNTVYWSNVSVPANLTYAQSAIYNDKLFIIGGTDNNYGVKMAEISIADVFSNMIYIANPDSNTDSNTDKYIKLIDNNSYLFSISTDTIRIPVKIGCADKVCSRLNHVLAASTASDLACSSIWSQYIYLLLFYCSQYNRSSRTLCHKDVAQLSIMTPEARSRLLLFWN